MIRRGCYQTKINRMKWLNLSSLRSSKCESNVLLTLWVHICTGGSLFKKETMNKLLKTPHFPKTLSTFLIINETR
jgi:hypothetical protein